jgi:outer membrane protein
MKSPEISRLPAKRSLRPSLKIKMKPIFFILLACLLFTGVAWAENPPGSPVLTLMDAEKIALKNHPQIAEANYRALAAQEVVKETRAGYFPHAGLYVDAVGANAEGTRVMAGGLNNPAIYDRAAGGVELSQYLADFGHLANLTASSKYEAKAESQNAFATRAQVLLEVNASYFNALKAQAVVQVARQTLQTRQLLLDQVSLLASNKLRSELDVSFARVQLQQGKLLLRQSQNDSDAALTSLAAALGGREPVKYQLLEQKPEINLSTNAVEQVVETALATRPELLSLRDQYAGNLRYAKSERDARLPTIEAIGVAGDAPEHDGHLPDDYAAGGVQLSMPLFAGGYYKARQHEAEWRAESADAALRVAEDNIVRDVRVAWYDVNTAVEQLHTTEELVRNAAESFDLAQARYKIGSSSIVELSQAQLSLTAAQIDETNARYDVLIQQANLNFQTGLLQ